MRFDEREDLHRTAPSLEVWNIKRRLNDRLHYDERCVPVAKKETGFTVKDVLTVARPLPNEPENA